MWTNENSARHDRSKVRYPSDLTDAEWARACYADGPDEREVLNGLMNIHSNTMFADRL